jgi:parallel beta-helix repeat protein
VIFRIAADNARFGLLIWVSIALFAGNLNAKELNVVSHEQNRPDGNKASYSSLSAAMAALEPGDHLIIASGVYRETLRFPERNWTTASQTIIEGKGTVTVKGADIVTGWTALGGGLFFRQWKRETSQVAVDGLLLQQIGGTVFDGYPTNAASAWTNLNRENGGIWPGRKNENGSKLPVNSFYFDSKNSKLYVRLASNDLDKHIVEVSTRTFGAYGEGLANITIKNIAFELGNTSVSSRAGLVSLDGTHIVLDHVSVTRADSVGIDLSGDGNVITHGVANYCGQLGIKARGRNVSISSSETSFNNTRGFNKWWEAGGAKFVGNNGLQNSIVSSHVAVGNHGDGIWFDWKNRNNRIENSLSEFNKGFGIHYEVSSDATIVNNVILGNSQRGIYLPNSSGSLIAYNLVAGNLLQGIAIVDEEHLAPDKTFDPRPRANRVIANVVAWNGSALTLPGRLVDNLSDGNVYIDEGASPELGLGWETTFRKSFGSWIESTGQDRHSIHIQEAIDPSFRESLIQQRRAPDLSWYEKLRSTLPPVINTPDAPTAVAVPGRTSFDRRPGAIIYSKLHVGQIAD